MATITPGQTGQKYLDPKTLDKIKRLDVRARLVVEGFITGEHKSPYHGFAVEFAAHREYSPGTTPSTSTGRCGRRPTASTSRSTKRRPTSSVRSCSIAASRCATARRPKGGGWSKFDYAATAAASLTYLLQQQQDAVGLVTFNTKVDKFLPASSHPAHLKLMMHELEQTDAGQPNRRRRRLPASWPGRFASRGMIVLLSDLFVDVPTLAECIKQFRLRKHEVIVLHVMHEDELTFPFEDNTLFKGLEVDVELHTEPRALRRSYLEAVDRFQKQVRKICASAGVDYHLLSTGDPLDAALASYLAFRLKTRRNIHRR